MKYESKPCKNCSKMVDFQLTPDIVHYGKYHCDTCFSIEWMPKPATGKKRRCKTSSHRDKWKQRGKLICGVCGITQDELPEEKHWECDHIWQLQDSGPDKPSNTMMLCNWCHAIKNILTKRRIKYHGRKEKRKLEPQD